MLAGTEPALTPISPRPTSNQSRSPQASPNPFAELSRFTLENSSAGLNALNNGLGNTSFVAAALHGGHQLKGIAEKNRRTVPGWYEPNKSAGIWPGIYGPNALLRKHMIDTGLALGCIWSSFDGFAKYTSQTGSLGTGVAAGTAEAVNQCFFSFFYAEPIIYGAMAATMSILGKAFPKSSFHQINRELAGKVPKALVKNGIPTYYRLTRSIVGGAAGILTINLILAGFSKWITPLVAYKLGPTFDRLFPGKKPD